MKWCVYVKILVVWLLFFVIIIGIVGFLVIDFRIVWMVLGFFLSISSIIGMLWVCFDKLIIIERILERIFFSVLIFCYVCGD